MDVRWSRGGDPDLRSHYSTSYTRNFVTHETTNEAQQRNNSGAQLASLPALGVKGAATGFSRQRPYMPYSAEVDRERHGDDSRLFAPELQFETRTQRDYRPPTQSQPRPDVTERGMAPRPLNAGGPQIAAARPDTALAAQSSDSGFKRVTANTLPKSQTVRKVRLELPSLESETQARMADTWRPGTSSSMAGAYGGQSARAESLSDAIHRVRSSAYLSNADPSPADKKMEYLTPASESTERFSTSHTTYLRNISERDRNAIPAAEGSSSPFVWGSRPRPAFLPATSNAAYGAPIRTDLTATRRLARTDPVEYMHRTNFGDQSTMTQTFHDNKHAEAMKQGHDLLSRNRHVLGKAPPSGFSQNVDTFTYRPPRPTSGQRLTTMNQIQARQFHSAANTSRPMTSEMPSAAVRESGFTHSMRTHTFNDEDRFQQDLPRQRPEVLARLTRTNPFLHEPPMATTGRF